MPRPINSENTRAAARARGDAARAAGVPAVPEEVRQNNIDSGQFEDAFGAIVGDAPPPIWGARWPRPQGMWWPQQRTRSWGSRSGGGHRGNYPGRGECAIFVVAHPPAPVVPAASGIRVTHLDSELNPQARAAINAAVATLDDPAAAAPVPAQPRFLRKNNNLLVQKK